MRINLYVLIKHSACGSCHGCGFIYDPMADDNEKCPECDGHGINESDRSLVRHLIGLVDEQPQQEGE